MPNPPPRKRFQIHLSTAIVMMFVAGGMLGLNLRQQEYFFDAAHQVGVKAETRRKIPVSEMNTGNTWLRYTKANEPGYVIETNPMVIETRTRRERGWRYGWPLITRDLDSGYRDRYHYVTILGDAGIALTILFAVWFLCEWLIRRRAARKGT